MSPRPRGGLPALLLALVLATPALADPAAGDSPVGNSPADGTPAGDPAAGQKLFRACAFCHTLEPDGGNRAGPTLHALFGRPAGAVEGYPYSDALRHSGIVWTEDTVARLFEIGPDTMTPGSKMPLQRLPDAQARADLVAYLRQATAAP